MEGTIAPEQIIINGREFDPEDATRLIDLGSKYSKMESELNTSLDKVYPEYTRATQRNKELETQLAERSRELEEFQKKQTAQVETPAGVQEARKAARDLGLADVDYLKEQEYIKKSDLEEYFNQRQTQQTMADKILKDCSDYEKTIDGSDGRVPFDTEAVLAFANYKRIDDPIEAYNQMNKKGNTRWEQAQLEKAERPGLTTLRPGGKKTPQSVKVTDDNFKQLFEELRGGTE